MSASPTFTQTRNLKKLPIVDSRQKQASKSVGKRSKRVANPEPSQVPAQEISGRVTKQERVLTLLSRPGGVSVPELMKATEWQQHSVRGFLAGTVKKKLGLRLTSSKADGGDRRYHIAAGRGR